MIWFAKRSIFRTRSWIFEMAIALFVIEITDKLCFLSSDIISRSCFIVKITLRLVMAHIMMKVRIKKNSALFFLLVKFTLRLLIMVALSVRESCSSGRPFLLDFRMDFSALLWI